MAELVDALDLKSNVRKSVPVRVRPVAPLNIDMDRFIGKLIDAFIDLLGDLWDNKRKPENKKKTISLSRTLIICFQLVLIFHLRT